MSDENPPREIVGKTKLRDETWIRKAADEEDKPAATLPFDPQGNAQLPGDTRHTPPRPADRVNRTF